MLPFGFPMGSIFIVRISNIGGLKLLCWHVPFYVHPIVQDTNDHDNVIVHDFVEYDVLSGFDSQKAVCYLIIGAIILSLFMRRLMWKLKIYLTTVL